MGRINDIRIIGIVLTIFYVTVVMASGSPGSSSDEPVPQLVDQADKYNITEAQLKISSDLLNLIKTTESPVTNSDSIQSPYFIPANAATGLGEDLVYVYVYLKKGSSIEAIKPFVYEITDCDDENSVAVAWITVNKLEELASMEEVMKIRTALPPVINVGSVNTQGDDIHGTANVRADYGQDGTGIKIGVISDGVDHLADSQASGDLPADVTVLSNSYGGDEGTAMLEIIHDMVPGAKLYFHDCGANTIAFNKAMDNLAAAGCNIIVDDILWFTEPYFEDGENENVAAHMANLVNSTNILFVSSAGNHAGRHYQGTYVNNGNNLHDKYFTLLMKPGSEIEVYLQWDDPFTSSSNDYDLYLTDENDIVVMDSTDPQNGTSGHNNPFEYMKFTNPGPEQEYYILIENYDGLAATRTLELFFFNSTDAILDKTNLVTEDSIFGHPAVPSVIAVAAISSFDENHDDVQYFSSEGPVTIAHPVASQRQKPDICGVDEVNISGAGKFGELYNNSWYFPGTSAAAPHVAAVAAQIWTSNPSMTAVEVRNILLSDATDDIDTYGIGFDYISGYGIANASKYFINAIGDIKPPTSVTDLQETGISPSWIRWTWTNPTDVDFEHVIVYIDGSFVTNTTEEFYNSTGLTIGMEHTISTKTVDISGNINETWTNDSAITSPANGSTVELASRLEGEIFNVAVTEDYAYAADNETFIIIDITDPASPTLIGSYETEDPIYDIEVADNYAYVANYRDGLTILNVTDPTSPELISNYNATALTSDVAVKDNYVCLADNYNGLVILNITDPILPMPAGIYDTAGFAEGLTIEGNYAYVADSVNGLVIVNITDPVLPKLVGSYDTVGKAEDVTVSDRYAYVADGDDGLIILDISDPVSPKLIGNYNTSGYAYSTAVSGNYAYIADRYNGLVILDITNPSLPVLAGSYNTAENWVTDVAVVDNYAYVADTFNGLGILQVTPGPDITPPLSVTNLQETGIGSSWINWTWTKPIDMDFEHVMVYLDAVFVANTSEEFYNATELAEGTLHTISTKTVDTSGNINPSWMNDSATTTAPLTISELSGKDITSSSITLTWINSPDITVVEIYRNNIVIGNVTGSTSYLDNNLASDTTYNYSLIPYNIDDLEGKAVNVSLKTKSSISGGGGGGGSSTSKKSSSSGGGGGGGAGSAEDFANVAMKDVDTQYLKIDTNVIYEFSREGNPIQSISFYSLKNSGEITSTIEVLNSRSKLVNSTPEGTVYKYVNIWVGKAGFATPTNIKDASLKFKVNSSWIEGMDIDPEDVKLQRYNGASWEILPTTTENITGDFVVFKATTPGFSPFAITAEKALAASANNEMGKTSASLENDSINKTQPEKTPGFSFVLAVLVMGISAFGYRYLRRR